MYVVYYSFEWNYQNSRSSTTKYKICKCCFCGLVEDSKSCINIAFGHLFVSFYKFGHISMINEQFNRLCNSFF